MEAVTSRLVIWGAGDLGSRVACRWQGGRCLGLTATTRRHAALRAMGVEPLTGSAVPHLRAEDTLLLALSGQETRHEAVAALAKLRPVRRAVLISTTGYYGTPKGIIDEETEAGEEPRAQAIAATERAFLDWAGERGVVLRLGGLYRRGRGPIAALARKGTVRSKPANRPLPLIHYEDAATAAAAALQRTAVAPVYLVVTTPVPSRQAFYEAACARLGLPRPTFADPLPGPPAQYNVSRLRRDLLPEPAYPDWRAALLLDEESVSGGQENAEAGC